MATEAALNNSGGFESTMPLLEQLAEVFGKLKSHTEASLQLQNGLQWEDIKEHFLNLDKSYKSKFDEMVEKQKALEEKKAEALRLIAEKEAEVSAKEHDSLNQLQELRDAAVSSLAEVRQKYKVEVSELLDASGGKDKKVSLRSWLSGTGKLMQFILCKLLGFLRPFPLHLCSRHMLRN